MENKNSPYDIEARFNALGSCRLYHFYSPRSHFVVKKLKRHTMNKAQRAYLIKLKLLGYEVQDGSERHNVPYREPKPE